MGLKLSSSRVPDFRIDNLPVSVDEGQSISPTISISTVDYNIIEGAEITFAAYWEISGVGIASTDFENVGADGNPDPGTTLTGYVNLTGSTTSKQFPIGIRSDTFTDLNTNETATFSIYKDAARTQLSASDTFIINDTSPSTFEFLLVGGGGGGGYVNDDSTQQAGGGGGAGGVKVASHSDIFDNNPTVWIGIGTGGGSSSNGNSTYLRSNNNAGNIIDSVGGGGAGGDKVNGTFYNGSPAPSGGGSGGGAAGGKDGGSGSTYGNNGGSSNSSYSCGGGGGAGGNGESSGSGSTSGDGGIGYDLTNFFSELAGQGHEGGNRIAGGGGGGRTEDWYDGDNTFGASRGLGRDGGGDGRLSNNQPSMHGVANTGGGGGGADGGPSGYTSAFVNAYRAGGSGGSGIVYLKYVSSSQKVAWTSDDVNNPNSDHTVNSYEISSGGGIKKYWIHKITGDGTLSRIL